MRRLWSNTPNVANTPIEAMNLFNAYARRRNLGVVQDVSEVVPVNYLNVFCWRCKVTQKRIYYVRASDGHVLYVKRRS